MSAVETVKTVYLMRHAHAVAHDLTRDSYRPLDDLGRDQARRIAAALAGSGIAYAVTSPAARTRQTVAALALGVPVRVADSLYGGGLSALLAEIRALPDDCDTALVCGHNPEVAMAAHRLADPAISDPAALADIATHFPTATCCQLELGRTWDDLAGARLVRTLRAKRPRPPAA
ncbi:MAG: histidine phosphatase family protein [Propionibacteriaceae bacterium]|jgi:phosphohistidine phosphatase|nr:histidine phosphatase family protein [Propionibacteriaceae bacterium]